MFKRLSWDTETALFGPGRMAPPLSCVSYKQGSDEGLLDHEECKDWLRKQFQDPEMLHVGHNIAYDMAVIAAEYPELLPAIFQAYREGRVTDTMLRMMLLDNSIGRLGGYWVEYRNKKDEWDEKFIQYNYSLDACYFRATKKRLEKGTWQLKYGELRGIPISRWPEGARKYPLDDVRATDIVFEWQDEYCEKVKRAYAGIKGGHIDNPEPLADEFAQARSAFWIQLMAVWGIRTNPERADVVEEFVQQELEKVRNLLIRAGLVRRDGSRDTKLAKERMILVMGGEENCKKTEKEQVSLDEEACRESGDALLCAYAELTSLGSLLSKDIPAIRRGKTLPIHSKFRSFKASGRTASADPNMQNPRRLPGIRECFVPRPGKVFLDCDYDGLELRTLAQACISLLKKSRLAELLNDGKDPHLMFAAELMHISYEEAVARKKDPDVKNNRQLAKVANFGYPGGLGAKTIVQFAKGYDVEITEEEAQKLKQNWLKTFPEMSDYFALISKYQEEDPETKLVHVEQLFSRRVRGGMPYPAACNTYFQGLGADATKAAGFLISYECYVDTTSPLFGCRIVNYIHDQFIVECDEDKAHEAAFRLAELMVEGANPFLPDVPAVVSEPMVCRCWSKDAAQVWDRPQFLENGERDPEARLLPWDKSFEVKKRESKKKVVT